MRIARALVLCLLPSLASAQPVQILHAFGVHPPRRPARSSRRPTAASTDGRGRRFIGARPTVRRRSSPGWAAPLTRCGAAAMAHSTASRRRRAERGGHGLPLRPHDRRPAHAARVHRWQRRRETVRRPGRSGRTALRRDVQRRTRGRPPTCQRDNLPHRSVHRRVHCAARVHRLGATPASSPWGPLALGPDGMLYGTTRFGGSEEAGTIYRLNPATGAFTIVHAMTRAEGIGPVGPLLLDSDGAFYGSAYTGGNSTGAGTIFRFDPVTSQLQQLYSLTSATNGSLPGPLAKASDGHLYGTTDNGPVPQGSPRTPTLFRLRRTPAVNFETLRTFNPPTTGRGRRCNCARDRCPALRLRPDRRTDRHRDDLSLQSAGRRTTVRPAVLCGAPHVSARSLVANAPRLVCGWLPVWHHAARRRDRARARLSSEPGDRRRHAAGTLPGGPAQTAWWNSSLVEGPDGLLYGTSHSETDTVTGTASSASIRRPVRRRLRTSAPIRSFRPCSIRLDRWRVCPGRSTDFARRAPASTSSASTRRRTRSLTSRPRRAPAGRRRRCSRQPTVSST